MLVITATYGSVTAGMGELMQNDGVRRLMLVGYIFLSFFLFSSCTFEAKGIPVKDFKKETPAVEQETRVVAEEYQKEIAAMSRITGNSVFTEKEGAPDYKIGPGDILTIKMMEGQESKEYETVVRPDGRISYSFVDDILVSGYTAGEVDERLSVALKKYIKHPRIEVIVKGYNSKTVLLIGQINQYDQRVSGPGQYNLKGKTTLLDLISRAGGAVTGQEFGNADLRRVEVMRGGRSYTVSLYDVMFKGRSDQNIILDDGDIVTVPELPTYGERVYVLGEVASQGIYRLKDAHDLLAALSIAGGTTRIAVDSDVKIIRGYLENPDKPIILSANYDQILKRGDVDQNITLKDGDVVYVPRTVIGDINEFIANTVPLLDYLLYPGEYRDAYFDDKHLRFRKLK
jgi:protein involved in polysaccharide export with SLBB domain